MRDWDWSGARSAFERAIECSPDTAMVRELFTRWYLWPTGSYDEALIQAKRAVELDPLRPEARVVYAGSLGFNGLYDDAIREARETVRRFPQMVMSHWLLGHVHQLAGRDEESLDPYRTGVALSPDSGLSSAFLTMALARNGLLEEARDRFAFLRTLEKMGRVQPVYMAVALSALGEVDEAFEQLDRSCEARHQFLFYLRVRNFIFPELENDPRYMKLLRRMALDEIQEKRLNLTDATAVDDASKCGTRRCSKPRELVTECLPPASLRTLSTLELAQPETRAISRI